MEKVRCFEDLIAWQKARELTTEIYKLTASGQMSKDFGFRDQVRRASVSIMSNIAEGFERGGRAEFHQFLVIAKGSCGELRSQLYTALDVGYISDSAFEKCKTMTEEVGRIIGGLRVAIQRQRDGVSA